MQPHRRLLDEVDTISTGIGFNNLVMRSIQHRLGYILMNVQYKI